MMPGLAWQHAWQIRSLNLSRFGAISI